MLNLVSTDDKIRVVLSGAVTTNELHCYSSWSTNNLLQKIPGRNFLNTSGATPVNLVAGPLDNGKQVVVDYLSVYNTDTASATVTINFYDGSADHELFKATLAAGEKIEYVEGQGFRVFTNAGSLKTSLNQGNAPTSSDLQTAVLGSDITNDNATDDTMEDVTGLSFPVNSGSIYYFKFVYFATITDDTSHVSFSINGPTFTSLSYNLKTPGGSNDESAYDLPSSLLLASVGVNNFVAYVEGVIKPSANGTIIGRFSSSNSNGGDNLTAKIGSFVQYQQVA